MPLMRRLFGIASAWLVAAAAVSLASSQPRGLKVERQGDHLRLSASQFHFLEGKPLERLHDGGTVTYLLSVTIGPANEAATWLRIEEPFLVSYDLWEEKFSVVQSKGARHAASGLAAAAAEAWCVEQVPVRIPAAAADKPFVVKLACSVVEEDPQPANDGLTLSTLIDVLSRRRAGPPPRWEILSAPLRLADLQDRARR